MATPALVPEPQVSRTERVVTLALVLSIAVLPLFIASMIAWRAGTPHDRPSAQMWFGLLHQANGLALLAYVLYKRNELSSLRLVLTPGIIGMSFALMICGYVVYSVSAALINTAHWFWTGEPAKFTSGAEILPAGLPVVLLLYIVASPVFEELIVRWFLTGELMALGFNWVVAAVATAALQASYHLYQGSWNAIAIFPLFLVFALYYAKTRRIWEVVLAHLWIDLIALAMHASR